MNFKRERALWRMDQRTNFTNQLQDPDEAKRWVNEYLEVCAQLPTPLVKHHKEKLGKQTLCIQDSARRRIYVWEIREAFTVSVNNKIGVILEFNPGLNPWRVWENYRNLMGV